MSDVVIQPLTFRDRERPLEPDPSWAEFRQDQPLVAMQRITRDGHTSTMWMVSRYADVREVLSSPHLSNAAAAGGEGTLDQPGFLLSLDPPDHTRIRRMLMKEFTVKRVKALRPRVEEISRELLDVMVEQGPPADLMHSYALPVPSLVICELLGVPYADRDEFQRRSDLLIDTSLPPEQAMSNVHETNAYMAELVQRHRRQPGDDILGTLIKETDVTDAELGGIGVILLLAGHETTANMLGLSTLLLLKNPEQLALLRDDPGVQRTAIEEILRYLTIVNTGAPRLVTQDLTLAGQVIPAGDMIMVSFPSANRDTAFLDDADVLDLRRTPGPHVAFGHGIHQCIGGQLARMELDVSLPMLLRRLPGLRLDTDEAELTYRVASIVNGVRALPLAWDS